MGLIVKIGSANIDVDFIERQINEEWAERRPTVETPGGFAPSAAFSTLAQSLRDLRAKLATELSDIVQMDQPIDPKRAEDLKAMERLCFHAETDPAGRRRKLGDRLLDQGKAPHSGGSLLQSEVFRQYAEQGLAPRRDRIHIQIDHGNA